MRHESVRDLQKNGRSRHLRTFLTILKHCAEFLARIQSVCHLVALHKNIRFSVPFLFLIDNMNVKANACVAMLDNSMLLFAKHFTSTLRIVMTKHRAREHIFFPKAKTNINNKTSIPKQLSAVFRSLSLFHLRGSKKTEEHI